MGVGLLEPVFWKGGGQHYLLGGFSASRGTQMRKEEPRKPFGRCSTTSKVFVVDWWACRCKTLSTQNKNISNEVYSDPIFEKFLTLALRILKKALTGDQVPYTSGTVIFDCTPVRGGERERRTPRKALRSRTYLRQLPSQNQVL